MNTRYHSAKILCIGACCLFFIPAGCASKPIKESAATHSTENLPTAASLAGTEWLLEDLAGAGVLDNAQATLSFPKDFVSEGKISGNGSCNRFSGGATIDSGSIRVGPLAATRMACVPAVDDQETRYLKALQGAERLAFNGPYLLLYAKGLEKPLRFIKNSGK
jgi:heat shock protein HslJ